MMKYSSPVAMKKAGNRSNVQTMTERLQQRVATWLADHSILLLRISVGLVFLGFGALKFVPGASPAEALVVPTVDALTFGVLSPQVALVVTAIAECFIGVTLLTGRFLRMGLVVLGAALIGIMSPLVLFFGDLFPTTPTLAAQHVIKDIVLVASGLVIAARALGAQLVAPQ